MIGPMRWTAILAFLLSASCGTADEGPLGAHPRAIPNIADFASVAPGPQPSGGGALRAVETSRRGLSPATFLYSVGAELWSGRLREGVLSLAQTDATGAVLTAHAVDLSQLGIHSNTVTSAAGDLSGKVWLAVEEQRNAYVLVAIDPSANTVVRQLGIFSDASEYEHPPMIVSYDGGRLFVGLGKQLVALDATTGATVDDFSGVVQAALGLDERAYIYALAAGHGRVLVRSRFDDTDTFAIDLGTGQIEARIADVPIGALAASDSGYVGLDATGQAVFFDLEGVASATVLQTVALPRPALGLAAQGGFIYLVFADWSVAAWSVPAFIAFDPATLAPVSGFNGDPGLDWDFGNYEVQGIAADADHFYLARGVSFAAAPVRSHIFPVEIATGDRTGDFQIGRRMSNLCFSSGRLWLSESSMEGYDRFHRPLVNAIDPSNGVILETRTAAVDGIGPYASLLCTPNGVMASHASTRSWVSLPADALSAPAHFMHAFPTGWAGIEAYGYWWILDKKHSTLTKVEIPPTAL